MESTGDGSRFLSAGNLDTYSRRKDTFRLSTGTLAATRRAGPSTSRTGTSRLRSSRTATGQRTRTRTHTTRSEDAFVVALIENNTKEVGFCAYNLQGFDVELRQFSDFNSFSTTIATLCIFNPVEILLSLSSANGPLEGALQAYDFTRNIKVGNRALHTANAQTYNKFTDFPSLHESQLSYIARTYFNETQGALAVERLSTERCSNLANLGSSPYYLALACCGALLRYVEHTNNTLFTPGTLRIQFKPNEGTLFLDIATMEGLELLQNGRLQLGSVQGKSQLEAMDKTKSRAGARLLRRSLLEPPAELETIALRQDVVEELSNSEELYFHVVAVLSKFPDLERALAGLLARENARVRRQNWANKNVHTPATPASSASGGTSSRLGSRSIDYTLVDDTRAPNMATIKSVIFIKSALDTLDEVLKVLKGVKSSLLLAIARSMRIPELGKLQDGIDRIIVADAEPSKDVEHMRLQGAFAVKTGLNEQLDVARKTLSENVEEMHSLTESLQTKYDFHKLSLAMSAKRGYHFTFPAKRIRPQDLPQEFIQVQPSSTGFHRFSTVALNSLNERYMESLAEIWSHTDFELRSLLDVIFAKRTVIALYRLCDSVALLDLLASFVTYSSLSPVPHIRPRMTKDGPIALRQAHHPILLALNAAGSVPNDIFIDETSALHIITGQNQSGKSTLLKCVGLLSVIAQTGATVPAEFASFRILHKLLSRFNTSDDINQAQSHFSREMHEVAAILDSISENMDSGRESLRSRSCTPTTGSWSQQNIFERRHKHVLLLMDELGRSTATLDGFSMAFAILERLIATPGVFTFFTTHFLGLAALEKVHPVIKVFHLATTEQFQAAAAHPGSTIVAGDSSAPIQGTAEDSADQITKRTQFTYRVASGVLGVTRYGIDTARAAGFPKNIIMDAIELREKLAVRRIASSDEFASVHFPPQAMSSAKKAKGTLGVVARVSMFRSTATNSDSLRQQLQQFQSTVKSAREAHLRSRQSGGSVPSSVSQ